MTFKTIMVNLDLDSPASPRIAFAKALARKFKAGLVGFAAAEPHVFVPNDESGMVAAELMRRSTEEIERRLLELEAEFLYPEAGEHCSWRGEVGHPATLLATHARAADLIVTAAPAPGIAEDPHRTVDGGTLILSAGRPVLFAAHSLAPLKAEKVLVAWKDAREARRAVSDAMPFLRNAREVIVATIADGDQKAARESAADVVRFLVRHGAKAKADVMGVGQTDRKEALADIARELGADLIVAGGYGHSRVREWAFGGMTRSFLADGSFHRLISN